MSPRRELTSAGGIWVRAVFGEVARSLRFSSRIPVPTMNWETDPHGPPDFRTMPRVVPIAGALIGALGAAAILGGHALGLGAFVNAALATAVLTLVTGAFHEDGLADTADGFGGGATPERRLEIMKTAASAPTAARRSCSPMSCASHASPSSSPGSARAGRRRQW